MFYLQQQLLPCITLPLTTAGTWWCVAQVSRGRRPVAVCGPVCAGTPWRMGWSHPLASSAPQTLACSGSRCCTSGTPPSAKQETDAQWYYSMPHSMCIQSWWSSPGATIIYQSRINVRFTVHDTIVTVYVWGKSGRKNRWKEGRNDMEWESMFKFLAADKAAQLYSPGVE